jgi:hypothetical protein
MGLSMALFCLLTGKDYKRLALCCLRSFSAKMSSRKQREDERDGLPKAACWKAERRKKNFTALDGLK